MDEPETEKFTKLTILHFNDAYNITERDENNCGGVARFVGHVRRQPEPKLTLFSGDLWSPSKQSALFKGEQLILPMNRAQVDCACLGNHDFDLGLDQLQHLNSKCDFPWLLSNLTKITGTRFANSLDYHIMERAGLKIGLIGLVEYDWIATLNCLDVDDLIYEDFVKTGNTLSEILVNDHSCDMVIALTHMRWPNDLHLARHCTNIDLILGGHDHMYAVDKINHVLVVKSGTDFLNISEINITAWDGKDPVIENTTALTDENVVTDKSYMYLVRDKWKVELIKRDITRQTEPDEETRRHIQVIEEKVQEKMKVSLFYSDTVLDTKFVSIRTRETAIGNFITDLIRKETCADCSIFNSGSIRADILYQQNIFKIGDLESILPYLETVLLVEITGQMLLDALENSVSKLPALEGRFLQVSHMNFEYDLSKPSGARVRRDNIIVDGDPMNLDKKYKVAMTQYLYSGKDGYTVLRSGLLLSPSTNTRKINEIMYEFFFMFSNHDFLEEFRIYLANKEELTINYIRKSIQKKKEQSLKIEQSTKIWAQEMEDPTSLQSPKSPIHFKEFSHLPHKTDEQNRTSSLGMINLPVLKILTRFNIDLLFSQKAILSLDCLVRLRKYQMIVRAEKGHEKQILPVIAPKVEKRITLIN